MPTADTVRRLARTAVRALPDRVLRRTLPTRERFDGGALPELDADRSASRRLYIGPSNLAGQGWQWARAAERLDGVIATSMSASRTDAFRFPVDVHVPYAVYRWSNRWHRRLRRFLAQQTHVLIEAGRPPLGDPFGRSWTDDVAQLRRTAVVGAVFHGSEIRLPSRHAERMPWSPFRTPLDGLTARLETIVSRLHRELADLDAPRFVSTPDLLVDLPEAHWLPVVVDIDLWHGAAGPQPLTRARPVVAHAPSNAALKGTAHIDPVLRRLHGEGVIEYRRIQHIPNGSMPAVVGDADIVVDQLQMGIYGVAACEAMAAGRVVISEVSDQVRDHVRTATGFDLPIIQADPSTIESVLRTVVAHRADAILRSEQGPEFVRSVHDGRRSAEMLSTFLGIQPALRG